MADQVKEPLTNEPTSEAAPHYFGELPHLSDTTVVFGREVTVRGGIYTVVFGFLAVATLIEVILGGFKAVVLHPACCWGSPWSRPAWSSPTICTCVPISACSPIFCSSPGDCSGGSLISHLRTADWVLG